MGSLAEERTRHFYAWERRGRGWHSYPFPVALEPPFAPFRHLASTAPPVDDGRQHTLLSALLQRFFGKRKGLTAPEPDIEAPEPEPSEEDDAPVELRVLLPANLSATPALSEVLLKHLAALRRPLSFELIARAGRVSLVLTARRGELPLLASPLRAFFPGVVLEERPDFLVDAWDVGLGTDVFFAGEFGLRREFVVPLDRPKSFSPDPLTAIVGALAQAAADEVAIVQVLFQGVQAPWAESIARSVVTRSGDPFFADAPEVTALAREKASAPLFAALLRVAARGSGEERLWTLLRGIFGSISATSRATNELILLGSDDIDEVLGDVLLRTTHRSGMILSLPELLAWVHLPSASIESLVRESARTKALPAEGQGDGILLGYNIHAGVRREVRLGTDARLRHLHVVGASGTGKSTLLVSMILEDIGLGHGLGVIDPHGDLIDEVLSRIPENRADDVILFGPADPEYAVGWNMLSATSEAEKDMLASDLVAVFRRLATSWGDQMTAVLANAILAFLESDRGGTLLDLRRFLMDAAFRREFLATVHDRYARDFWTTEFPTIKGSPQASILTRLDTLLRSRLVRGVVTAKDKPLDFRRVVDDRRIFLAKLSQGAIGEENAALLGSLLVSKLHQVCLLRQDQPEAARRPFYLYLDEFHNLATPSMASLFSGARKYRLGLTVAHQDLYQLRKSVPEVERAVLANAYNRIAFRLGDEDARILSQGFSFFEADDLGNLGTGEAICRIGRKEHDFNLSTVPLKREDPEALAARRRDIRAGALARWGTRRSEESTARPAPEEPRTRDVPPRTDEPRRTKEAPNEPQESPKESPSAPPAPEPRPAAEERRPGKGGPEHTYLQELIKRWAEEHGFRAVVEEQIAGSRESIDVALYRGDLRIACEVSVTTPLEYEAGNVEKCLAAGFGMVAVVSLKKTRLQKLDKLLAESLPAESYEKVRLFTPEELLSWLAGQPVEVQEGTVRGYKVKVRYSNPGDDRHKRVAEILAKSTGGLKKDE